MKLIRSVVIILAMLFASTSSYGDKVAVEYVASFDVVFTARYVKAGLNKRYLVENIYKGAVDKRVMDFVINSPEMNYRSNAGLVLFLFNGKKGKKFGLSMTIVESGGGLELDINNRDHKSSLEEIKNGLTAQHK